MTPGRDDDALSWDGDDDPTLDVGAAPEADAVVGPDSASPAPVEPEPAALPDGFHAVGPGSETVGRIAPDGTVTMPDEQAPMGNAMLVALGVFGGVYLLFTLGWVLSAGRLEFFSILAEVPDVAFVVGIVLAAAAPALWFVTAFVVTRGRPAWIRILWLAAGAVLLLPWPFLMLGVIGQ